MVVERRGQRLRSRRALGGLTCGMLVDHQTGVVKSVHQPTFGATRPRTRASTDGHTRPLAHLLRASALPLLTTSRVGDAQFGP